MSRPYIILLAILIYVLSRAAEKKRGKKTGRRDPAAKQPSTSERRNPAAKPPSMSERRRAEAARPEQWRAAKRQQDDAEQVHSIRMDSCESRLESLRVLHEAGILDNEEYAQRVARVRARHARNAGR